MAESWQIPGTKKDRESITKDWQILGQTLIDGVQAREVKNVPTGYGHLTEIFRQEWEEAGRGVDQVFQSTLQPGGLSAWHAHALTTDRLFVSHGRMLIALYDPRPGSPTHGTVNVFRFGSVRPALLVVPPRVYHGVQNLDATPSFLLNVVDRAYDYVDPDHYRLPWDTDRIPYRFERS